MSNFNIHDWRFNNLLKESKEVTTEEWDGVQYKPGTIAPKDLYYSDKHGRLVAKDDVDEKYHDRLELVYRKGDEIESPLNEESYKVAGRRVTLVKGKKSDGTDWKVKFQNGKEVPLSDVLALIKPFPKGIKESVNEENELEALEAQKAKLEDSPVTDHSAERLRDINDKIDIIKANLNELTDEVDYEGYARKFLSELREAGIDRGDAERVIISMKANLGMVFEEVDEAKKKDPVRRDTEEERAGAQQAGRRMRTQVVPDKKAAYKRGDRKHKKGMYEKALEEANRQLEKRKQQNS